MNNNVGSAVNLFCLPYAGGGGRMFHSWIKLLPDFIRVFPVELPGRESKLHKPAFHNMELLVAMLASELYPIAHKPYAIFGHSMGAIIAFELALSLTSRGCLPCQVFISAAAAPHLKNDSYRKTNLSDEGLRTELKKLGGMPNILLDNTEFMKMFLPTVRADFILFDSYTYKMGQVLKCPVTVLGGRDDDSIKLKDLLAWNALATGDFQLRLFKGNHFFLHSSEKQVLQTISNELSNNKYEINQ